MSYKYWLELNFVLQEIAKKTIQQHILQLHIHPL